MKTVSSCLLLALIAISPLAGADDQGPITAGEVASWCEPYRHALLVNGAVSVDSTAQSQSCYGAFITIQQLGATIWDLHDKESLLRTCLPPTSRTVELIQVFLHYTDEHPERGHDKFTAIALVALRKAYPCPSSVSH